jgi:programmed cell death protein 4
MADFAKRPEVTVTTMGKVHNPTGEGVRAVSKNIPTSTNNSKLSDNNSSGPRPGPQRHNHQHTDTEHETKVKEVGTTRRNITRKKSDSSATGNFDSQKKKHGGAGKGKWNDSLDGSDHIPVPISKDDPLYDDDAIDGSYVLASPAENIDTNGTKPTGYDPLVSKAVYGPMYTLPEFKIRVKDSLLEYFDSGDVSEFIISLQELKCREFHPEVVKKAISISLDQGPRERELTSRLLTCLHPEPLHDQDMSKGFEMLLGAVEDLVIDIPDAKYMVGAFLARGVVDEVLPPAFLSNRTCEENSVIEHAVKLLSREHCTARLEKVWGPGDGRPVEDLKIIMDQLLKEYLLSRELDEAALCVKELNAPHFHHELVKRAVKIAMEEDGGDGEKTKDASIDAMAALFSFLVKNAIVSDFQVSKGVSRLKKILPDLKLDVPGAPGMLKEFEELARERGCFPQGTQETQ